MKILMVNTTFLPGRVGGAELHTLWLAQEWLRMGHDVMVVCRNNEKKYVVDSIDVHIGKSEDVTVLYVTWPTMDGISEWGVHKALLDWAYDFLDKQKPDFVHFGLFWGFVAVAEAASRLGIPYGITAHLYSIFCYNGFLLMPENNVCDGIAKRSKCRRCLVQSWSFRHRFTSFAASLVPRGLGAKWAHKLPVARGLKAVEEVFTTGRRFAERASLLIAPTHFVCQELQKNGYAGSKIAVIPYGLAPQLIEFAGGSMETNSTSTAAIEKSRTAPFRICLVSRLSPEKGIDTLILAFVRLPKNSVAQLDIYGSGPKEYVEGLHAMAQCDERIRFHGSVPHKSVPQILSEADVAVVPSEWKEVSGINAREALALGIPVIAAKTGGLPEAVQHERNGLLVEPGDVEGYRKAMERCINGTSPRKPLPQEVRGIVTITENAKQTEAALSAVIRGGNVA